MRLKDFILLLSEESSNSKYKVLRLFQLRQMTALRKTHPLDRSFDPLKEGLHYDILRLVKLAIDEQGGNLNLAQLRLDVPGFQISNNMEFGRAILWTVSRWI